VFSFCVVNCVVNLDLGKLGPHPGGSYGVRGDLFFYVGGRVSVVVPDKLRKVETFHFTYRVQRRAVNT
jgi:hypothetical protein